MDTVAYRLTYCTASLAGPGLISAAGTVNHTVHPSEVGKLVAISRQLGGHCRILRSVKSADRQTAGVKAMLPEALTTSRRFSAGSHVRP